MKLALEEYMSSAKNLNYQMKRLKDANQVLERKLRAEQAEKMSMSNASYISAAGLGLGGKLQSAQKDILSRSIMENHNAGGNTSIMDIMSGYNMPMNTRELNNKSMSMNKGQQRSFIKSQSSFYSKDPNQVKNANESSDSGGEVIQVDDNNMSDSDDCVIEEKETKAKGTGFYYKQQLKETVKKAKVTDAFREGESDEYDSEADDIDVDMDALDYDLLRIREGHGEYHAELLALVMKFGGIEEEVMDSLTFKKAIRSKQKQVNEE